MSMESKLVSSTILLLILRRLLEQLHLSMVSSRMDLTPRSLRELTNTTVTSFGGHLHLVGLYKGKGSFTLRDEIM